MKDNPPSNEIQQQPEHQGTEVPLADNFPSAKTCDSKSNNEKKTRIERLEDRIRTAEKWMIFLTGLIFVVTVAGVLAAYLQWKTMDGQLDEMRSNGKQTDKLIAQVTEQAKAANRLAEIASTSLAENRQQFQSDQRPYIISNIVPVIPTEGAPLSGRVSVVNYGKTPALKVGTYTSIFFGRDAMKQADRWFAAERNQRFDTEIGTSIPPGIPVGLSREIPSSSEKSVTREDIDLIMHNDTAVVLVARHLYFDTVGNSYGTDSCFRVLKGWLTAYCEGHNVIH